MKRFYSCQDLSLDKLFKYQNCPFCNVERGQIYCCSLASAQCLDCKYYISLKFGAILNVQSLASNIDFRDYFVLDEYEFALQYSHIKTNKKLADFKTITECLNYGFRQLKLNNKK